MCLSHLSESNQRPTDYKSVALPTELKWRMESNKELPQKFRKAKVMEFDKCKNFEDEFFMVKSKKDALLHQKPVTATGK